MSSVKGVYYFEGVVFAAIVCGLIMFNTIFIMLYMVARITEREIRAKCMTEDCTCDSPCSGIKKVRRRFPYLFYFNLAAAVFLCIDLCVWGLDIYNIIR